ncbi:MAG: methionyl aminopeptidase [Parcubacteria group bacterium Athens0714_26]|nr:MAG: methionyl aminopeptidase [Parcubacteria group bacterium Athens0714_26]
MVKTEEQIKKIRIAGKILAGISRQIEKIIKEGTVLKEIDKLVERLITEAGAKPAFLGYQPGGAEKPFPASICASINEVVVHGIPGDYRLQSGDLLKLDFGVDYKGGIADGAFTMARSPWASVKYPKKQTNLWK